MVHLLILLAFLGREQPPPRGCVLKLICSPTEITASGAAASAWLCVETCHNLDRFVPECAAASAWLCVETVFYLNLTQALIGSRLRVAVC